MGAEQSKSSATVKSVAQTAGKGLVSIGISMLCGAVSWPVGIVISVVAGAIQGPWFWGKSMVSGAIDGLMQWGLSRIIPGGSAKKIKLMKAPGRNGYIDRAIFEANPSEYFKKLRGLK